MGYKQALEAAGATVQVFETFGDWQGSWYAKVIYQGKQGWVVGSYGSCSGCDAFQAEFDYGEDPTQDQLADFGRGYLDGLLTQTEAEISARTDSYWDLEKEEVLKFVQEHAIR